MGRKAERENLMKLVYEMQMNNDFSRSMVDSFSEQFADEEPDNYFRKTADTIIANLVQIDNSIEKHSVRWKKERMPAVDLAVLRVAAAEIMYDDSIPPEVSVNEAVELAKKYGTEKSPGFINGLLGGLVKEYE